MTISLTDYAHTAANRGWGAGWPSCAGASGNIVTVTLKKSGTRFNVHKRIAVLVGLLGDWTESRGYLGKPAQCGGYNCRAIAGTNTSSNHAWGLALDWNWTDNPYTTTGQHTIPSWMPPEWNKYGFAWGGAYTSAAKDFMHWEFMGTPADADAQTILARSQIAVVTSSPTTSVLQAGSTGAAVSALQARLNRDYPAYSHLTVDGVYGAATKAVVEEFQRRAGLVVDGIAGPATLAKLGLA